MKTTTFIAKAALALASMLSPSLAQEVETARLDDTPQRSISTTRQFVIYGSDLAERARFSAFAESLKEQVTAILGRDDFQPLSIVIRLIEIPGDVATGPLVKSSAEQVQGAYRFTLGVKLVPELSMETVERELLEVLLFEQILRQSGKAGAEKAHRLRIPPWMVDGLHGAIRFRTTGRKDRFFRQLFNSGQIMSVPEILRCDLAGKTSVEKLAFEASATGLVLALLGQPGGSTKFQLMLRDLLDFDGRDEAVLLVRFPELGATPESMDKWWALELAALAEPSPLDIMTIIETEAALQQALFVIVPVDAKTTDEERKRWLKWPRKTPTTPVANDQKNRPTVPVPLQEIETILYIAESERGQYLEANKAALNKLRRRAYPLYRPLIDEYTSVIDKLAKGEKKKLPETLERLTGKRTSLLKISQEVQDLLHWSEVNQPVRDPARFSDFHQAIKDIEETLPSRDDAISEYLDALEAEWAE
ncbi:MAG: hypothetical protein AAGJ79_10975 [Verrucomicrobiota bacterium]